jgi:choice-of-anchor B domain-containing protein
LAGEYPCSGFDLVAHLSLSTLGAASGNDIWGWTDPDTGIEYALMGLDNGTAFISLEVPEAPVLLGKLPSATGSSPWRDIKVYQDHAFIVSEATGHGMQVFDLTQLRSVNNPPATFSASANYTEFGSAHNIVINEDSGFAYVVGTSAQYPYNGGAHFVDIQTPTSPQAAGGYGTSGYTHDAQVVTYSGPDPDYSGREIFIGANENRVVLVDVTDKTQPEFISQLTYTNIGYTHQGWFTDDQRFFLLGDETDELSFGLLSRTLVFDFTDLNDPVLHTTYSGPTTAIDHNGYVLGDTFYLANYTAGIRVVDISGIGGRQMDEIGFFDTYPNSDVTDFNGVWSLYPYLDSGLIFISDINRGFFAIRASEGTTP